VQQTTEYHVDRAETLLQHNPETACIRDIVPIKPAPAKKLANRARQMRGFCCGCGGGGGGGGGFRGGGMAALIASDPLSFEETVTDSVLGLLVARDVSARSTRVWWKAARYGHQMPQRQLQTATRRRYTCILPAAAPHAIYQAGFCFAS